MLTLIAGVVFTAVPAHSLVITSGTPGGFEIDGNEVVNTTGNLDWKNVSPIVVTDDILDSGFRGSSKELTPAGWVCNTGGANPNKANLLRVYANPRASANSTFLDLAWVRENVNGSGEVTLEFELNQVASPEPASFKNTPCPLTRTVGDLLVAFDFPGGNAAPVINIFRWTGTTWDATVAPVTGSGAVNTAAIAAGDDIAGIAIDATRFGEATLNLTGLIGGPNGLPCTAFNQLNTRSRSSNAIDSALQDRISSIPINLCPNQPQPGRIVVFKNTVPVGSTGTFPFVTTPAAYASFSLSGGDSHDSGALPPGTYSVAETVPTDWTLTGATCDNFAYTPGDFLTLAAGQTITCVFTDTPVIPPTTGHIIVQKVTNVASTDSFHFTTSYPPNGFSLTNGTSNDAELAPNTYTVSEDTLAGWDLTSAVCKNGGDTVAGPVNIVLAAGQTVICVFTNTQQGTLEVVKALDPISDPGKFNLAIDGTTLATDVGNGGTTGAQFVSPADPHTVSEAAGTGTSLSDYTSSILCTHPVANQNFVFALATAVVASTDPGTSLNDVPVPAGDHVVCTITNTRKPSPPAPGSVTIVKDAQPNSTQDFTFTPSAGINGGVAFLLDDDGNNANALPNSRTFTVTAGLHTVTEAATSGFDLTSIVCDDSNSTGNVGTALATLNVAAGEHVTCTFTNVKHGVYGNDPSVNPTENPYAPGTNPGGQPAGDTGQPGATVGQPSDPTQVAGTNLEPTVADPSTGNPVLDTVEGQVNLPRTGAELVQQALAGLVLLGAGLLLLAVRRRRSGSASA